jgi:hypothetical protein
VTLTAIASGPMKAALVAQAACTPLAPHDPGTDASACGAPAVTDANASSPVMAPAPSQLIVLRMKNLSNISCYFLI